MAKFILFDLENSKFHNEYEEDEKKVFGGPWGDESKHVHLPLSDGIDYRKYDLIEVIIPDGQTEDDIVFDYKCTYNDNFNQVVKYYRFEVNTSKSNDIDAQDALQALKDAKNAKKIKGKAIKELCNDLLGIVAGHVRENNLTAEQLTQLKTDNADIFTLLKDTSPITAKPLIDALVVDGTLITQELYDDLQLEYTEFNEMYPDI